MGIRMMTTTLVLALAAAGTLQAQTPVSLELRGGAAFPTDDLGEASLNTGGGAGFGVHAVLLPRLGVYAGWDLMRFSTDSPFAGAQYDVENTGYVLGLEFGHPITGRIGSWARAGGMYGHIELEDRDDVVADSGHEFGWEAGVGLNVVIGSGFALLPGVRYRMLSVDLTDGADDVPVDLSYVTAEIGFRYTFGTGTGTAALIR